MPRIGFIPSKTSIEVRDPDGDVGTLPAASPSAAGCMTAEHVRMLEAVYTWHQSQSAGDPIVIEHRPDTSHLVTRSELQGFLARLPQAPDVTPEVRALRSQLSDLHGQISNAAVALSTPAPSEVVDEVARDVIRGFVAGMEAMDERLRHVESALDTLRMVAAIKARDAA